MKNIKIAFFDIDGTLVDMNTKQISKKMIETLQALQQKGIKLCIATGRPPFSVPHFEGVDFDAYLTFNASYCYGEKGVIFKNAIPTKDVMKIIENAKSICRPLTIANAHRMGANGEDGDMKEYFAISKQQVQIVDDFEQLAKSDIYQIMMGCQKDQYEQVLKDVDGAIITAWWDRAIDIIPANGGKGLGVEKVLEYFQLEAQDAIAFGDGSNDIEMLKAVGYGIAMGNASEDVKEIADDICDSVAEEGIYTYCVQHHMV